MNSQNNLISYHKMTIVPVSLSLTVHNLPSQAKEKGCNAIKFEENDNKDSTCHTYALPQGKVN